MIQYSNDWHKADIIAAIHKKGSSLAELSRQAGLSSSTLANALKRPWPKGERIIAEFLGVAPMVIWPSRYTIKSAHNKRNKTSG
ncbi:TPA: helix-turn-helix domain-containing protein [Yersinia enterocolitica]|uniref:helix-turn-helix domain-containing protein n=1 Tax=Yersinia enterocolitica TaxID=630 RepID=UPI002AC5A3D5|nr:helix-turn-helix domain-containing protein [Yersinia enterocolitica]HDM8436884.1 helix-turn-helix domain-containing protein [Yersinia enterocolitica]HEN3568731.1 helix-turn-helix domain-containing protein [Yersinia enterocolitica]HEN3572789.1 helix-turn-helix domain-containing protein [Yersinia enterocolitica]HEN3576837.1 helix-turn-helix domain-containing protein [Yersinia enterocolitica]